MIKLYCIRESLFIHSRTGVAHSTGMSICLKNLQARGFDEDRRYRIVMVGA